MFATLERSEITLEEILRQPAPVDHGPVVCAACGHHGALLDGRCFPCNGFDVKGR